MNFNRQSRTLLRIFKGKNVKFEVWSKGYVRFCPCIRSVFHSRLILTNRGNLVFIVLISILFFSGFLRSDTLVGTATVKLADLLNHCVLHTAVEVNQSLNKSVHSWNNL